MDPVLVLRHGADITAGYLGDALADAGVPAATVSLYAGAPLPEGLDWAAVVSLGGVMGAYQEGRYPYLKAEKDYLRRAASAGVPVLGICLGCQLLADALSGRAFKASEVEMGVFAPDLTAAGRADPIVGELDGPVLVWHEDTWEAPPGAEILATSPGGPQAFRAGDALGIQAHPEVSPDDVRRWVKLAPDEHFAAAGMTRDELVQQVAAHADESRAVAARMFGAWVDGLG